MCLLARSAFESFARLYKGGGVQGQSPCPRSAERGTLLYAHKRSGRGSKGETLSRGFPLFLLVCTCAPLRWVVVVTLPCRSTPFLWCLPKETVSSRQRKALFYPGGSTIRVSAAASVVFTHLRPTCGGGWWVSGHFPSPGANGICYGRFARLVDCAGVTVVISFRSPPKARFFGAPPRFFAQEQRNGVERAVGGETSTQENGAHVKGAKKAPSGRTGLLSIKGRPWPSRTGR